jgi:hypothetical protein
MNCNPRTALGLALIAASLTVGLVSARAEEPWQPCSAGQGDGVTLERRAVPGSKFYEYRASAQTPAPPEAVLHGIWNGVTEQLPAMVKLRKVLSSSDIAMVFYDQLTTKVVSDRDYTLRISWTRNPQTGVIEVPFSTMNELGPPPAAGHVRVPIIRGDWIITPVTLNAAAGSDRSAPSAQGAQGAQGSLATEITYLCYSEPGGSIPAFMARGAQQEQVLIDMRRILKRALQAGANRPVTAH